VRENHGNTQFVGITSSLPSIPDLHCLWKAGVEHRERAVVDTNVIWQLFCTRERDIDELVDRCIPCTVEIVEQEFEMMCIQRGISSTACDRFLDRFTFIPTRLRLENVKECIGALPRAASIVARKNLADSVIALTTLESGISTILTCNYRHFRPWVPYGLRIIA